MRRRGCWRDSAAASLFGLLALSIDPPEVITGPAWVGVSAAVAVAFGLAGGLLAVPVLTPRLHAALRGWGIVWLPAMVWAGVEYLRLVTTAGHQWGMTATAQIDVAPLRAFLPLAGMWPMPIIVMATNGAIVALILAARGRWMWSRAALGWSVGAVAAAWILGGILALLPPPEATGTLRAAVVQPGEHVPDHPLTRPLIVRRQYAELTEVITALHAPPTVAAQGAQLVVWPEASGWVDPLTPTGTGTGAAGGRRRGAVGRDDRVALFHSHRQRSHPQRSRAGLTRIGRLSAPRPRPIRYG